MYAGFGAVSTARTAQAVHQVMVTQLCTDAGRPGDPACLQRASELLGTKSREEIIAELREGPGRKWLIWGAAGAVLLVGGALVLTRKKKSG